MMARIHIINDPSGRIIVSFPYDPLLVEKVKIIDGRRWHPAEKHWSFPNTDGTLQKILKVFEGEELHIDPALTPPSPLNLRGERGELAFENLRKELVSRKYSYKTIKGYLYYNKDFINHVRKNPSEIKDEDIKDYLVYLSEEKGSAISTLNQAINALKFYYGTVLKKKFVYEVKRPRKDKKLPTVLSKEEVGKILSSVDNVKHKAILMLVYSGGKENGGTKMIDLEYSLTIEATKEPDFFGFYSPDLPGFSGIGHSVEDCLYKAKWGMIEHVNLLREQGLPIPPKNVNPKIIIQKEESLKAA